MTPWFALPKPADAGWQTPGDVAIVGAGLAGLCAARALLQTGFKVTVYEAAEHIAAGASASPAGIVKPYLTRQPTDAMRFYAQAFETLFTWLNELPNHGGFQAIGALQLVDDASRYTRITPLNEHSTYEAVNPQDATQIASLPIEQSALFFKHGGWLSIQALCNHLKDDVIKRGAVIHTQHALIELARSEEHNRWVLQFEKQANTLHQQVVLANGATLANSPWLPKHGLIPARGQVSAFKKTCPMHTVISGRHYAIPDKDAIWVGASFNRGNNSSQWLDEDDEQNRHFAHTLLPGITAPLDEIVSRFAGVRCTTLDRFPLVGPVPDFKKAQRSYHDIHHGRNLSNYPAPNFHPGLAVIGGLGSRGITAAPHISVLLADWASGGTSLHEQNRLLSPLRFLIRQLKRQAE